MNVRALRCAAALLALLAGADAGAQALSQLPDERAAIAAALEQRGVGRVRTVLMGDRTATFSCALSQEEVVQVEGCSGMMRRDENLDQVIDRLRRNFGVSEKLLAEMKAKGQSAVAVDKPFDFKSRQTIWAPGQGVARSHLAAPDLAISFSRPAFDERRDHALVYVAAISQGDPRRSFGEYVLLGKVRGKWAVAKRMRVWQLSPV